MANLHRSIDPVMPQFTSACPSCGKGNPAGNRFCSWCGAPVALPGPAEKSVADTTPQTICGSCSAALVPGHKFCTACGAAVGKQPAPLAAAAAAVSEGTQPRVVQGGPSTVPPEPVLRQSVQHEPLPQETVPPQPMPQEFQGPFPAAPKPGRVWIVAVALVAVAGIAGWSLWRYFSGPDVTVTVFPKKIHVASGGRTFLQASVSGSKDADVEWSVQEGNKGGKVVSQGTATDQGRTRAEATYTAPQTSGTFHVIAASHANSNRTATVEIVVGSLAPTPAPAPSATTNPAASQIAGTWRWPSGDTQMTIGADGTIVVTSSDPQKNQSGTYRFTDSSHVEVNFGSGSVTTWQILGVDSQYLRVLAQSKTETSPTAIVFARIGG